jgi:adenosylcobinamide-GDP ribazoletransferase
VGGLLAAFAFLTRLPVPAVGDGLRAAVAWLPAVGLALGAILVGVDWGLRAVGVPTLASSAVVVVALILLTGGLHADGFIDTCDAVFCHATSERRLEIMRDPHIGAFGVVGAVCLVALKIAAVDGLPPGGRWQALLLGPTLGRWAIVLVAAVFPYGRTHGLGLDLRAGATRAALILATVIPLALMVAEGPPAIVGFVLAALVALALGRWLLSLLPGLTGDSYGATCEVVETVIWLSAAPLARLLG